MNIDVALYWFAKSSVKVFVIKITFNFKFLS